MGLAFRDYLIEHLNDYSTKLVWDSAANYVIDDVVKYKGIYYKSTANSNNKMPPHIDFWKVAPRFDTECLETLWCSFLGPYLSWVMLEVRMPFVYTQIKSEGIVKLQGSDFKATDDKDYRNLMSAIKREIDKSFKNLHTYMLANNAGHCFDLYLSIGIGCCKTCGFKDCHCEPECSDSDGYEYRIA